MNVKGTTPYGIASAPDLSPYVFRIQRYCLHDGPGIRTTLFFQGCPLSCKWCHNPESQPLGPRTTPAGVKEILVGEIEKDVIFFDESRGGVTFSGGEPLCRPDLLSALLSACRQRHIHTCLDTSGFAPYPVLEQAALDADRVHYDVKIVDGTLHKAYTGRSSRPVLDNLKALSQTRVNLVVRFPLIPGYTDTDRNISRTADVLAGNTRFRDLHILPFHNTGDAKYRRLALENPMKKVRPPNAEKVAAVCRYFEGRGFNTRIGG